MNRFGAGAKVLIVGGSGVAEAIAEAGMVGVRSADDGPVAVLQGYGFDLTWQQLNEAAIAIHRGAYWVATNTDSTRPTDRGLVPGNGAAVAAVAAAVSAEPEVAGKPYRPLMDETVAAARAPIGRSSSATGSTPTSRAPSAPDWTACWCCPAPTERRDLLAAGPEERPTHLGRDLRALLAPPLPVRAGDDGFPAGRRPPGPTARRAGQRAGSGRAGGPLGSGARGLGGRGSGSSGRPGDQASCTALINSTAAQTR